MKNQVNILKELGFIDNNFISVDATPVKANTKFNNPKCFANNKFSKNNHPSSDKDCKLGVHTANNSMNVQVLEDKPNNSKKKQVVILSLIRAMIQSKIMILFVIPLKVMLSLH